MNLYTIKAQSNFCPPSISVLLGTFIKLGENDVETPAAQEGKPMRLSNCDINELIAMDSLTKDMDATVMPAVKRGEITTMPRDMCDKEA